MAADPIPERFAQLRLWKRAGHRAPHKPLLVLLALARIQRGEPRLISWSEVEPALSELLTTFGPPRRSPRPQYPFWRLRNDGELWEVCDAEQLTVNDNGDILVSELRKLDPEAGFTPEVDAALRRDPALVNRVAADLLDAHFAASLHHDILDAVGMPWVVDGTRRRRDPNFRREVLRIYEQRCAVCGYDGRLAHVGLALEAAHVRWHAADGPDTLDNGVALCVMHHRALDRGALAIDKDRQLLVSSHLVGASPVVDDMLSSFHRRPLREPQRGEPRVAAIHTAWHRREVFRGPARR